MERAIRIGVTGKIGSGKSTLLRRMEDRGIVVVNSDQLARALMEESTTLREKIVGLLGAEAYQDGKLDRHFVASKIFSDGALRKRVEAIVHPAVTREVGEIFRQSPPGKLVAVESALILQTEFWMQFDYIILVDAPDEIVLSRVRSAGHITDEDAKNRLMEQHWDEISLDEVDFTVENSGTPEQFESRCNGVLGLLEVLAVRPLPDQPLHALE